MGKLDTLRELVEGLPRRGGTPALLAFGESGVERLSYSGLHDNARALAAGLSRSGVGTRDHVAFLVPAGIPAVSAFLGAILAGATVVPLDAQLGGDALANALRDCEPRFVFADRAGAERLEGLDLGGAEPRVALVDGDGADERHWRRLLVDDAAWEPPGVRAEDGAVLFYTSGTTGAPKGVPLTHGNLAYQINALLESGLISPDDRVLLPLPLHHVYPFVVGMLAPLAAGLPVVLPHALTGPQVLRAIRKGEASLVIGVPRLYGAVYAGIEGRVASGGRVPAWLFRAAMGASVRMGKGGLRPGKLLFAPLRARIGPRLRVLAAGGAPLDARLAERLEALGWRVAIGYGLTETSPILTIKRPDGRKLGSVGAPIPGVRLRVDRNAMPDGAGDGGEGEILARGPGVFAGYRNRPEETEAAFTDGWFRTGDLGYLDDEGHLYVTGRASTLIVTESGKNVQPEEVEEAYAASPAISEVGVLQRGGKLVAVIVPEAGGSGGSRAGIREAVKEVSRSLPSYKRLGDFAVSREPLARTQLGKIRRHLLEEHYDRAKGGDEGAPAGPVEPEGADREMLDDPKTAEVWELIVRRFPNERISFDTSPQLDLGVDSMAWVELSLEIRRRTGVELTEEAIGRIETVRDLLREVREGDAAPSGASPLDEPLHFLNAEQRRYLEPLPPVARAASLGLYWANRAFTRLFFRLEARGLKGLPSGEQLVFAPNHTSYLDGFLVAGSLDLRRLRATHFAGGKGPAFGNLLTSTVSRLAQGIPIEDPARAGATSLAFGSAALANGKSLVWFPEGRRSPDGRLLDLKPGLGLILDRRRSAKVVPVAIRGAHEAMPLGSFLIRPRKITVTFGNPVAVDELEAEGAGETPPERITNALRNRIAGLLKTS